MFLIKVQHFWALIPIYKFRDSWVNVFQRLLVLGITLNISLSQNSKIQFLSILDFLGVLIWSCNSPVENVHVDSFKIAVNKRNNYHRISQYFHFERRLSTINKDNMISAATEKEKSSDQAHRRISSEIQICSTKVYHLREGSVNYWILSNVSKNYNL